MLSTIVATSAVSITCLAAASTGFMHFKYSNLRAPAPLNFKGLVNEKKEIVVVGSGIIGLTTAYYLA